MRLADHYHLTSAEIHLLANCSRPVFVLELSSVAEGLIQCGLVLQLAAVCQHSNRRCFLLVATEHGLSYVEEWIESHRNDASDFVAGRIPTDQTRSAVA